MMAENKDGNQLADPQIPYKKGEFDFDISAVQSALVQTGEPYDAKFLPVLFDKRTTIYDWGTDGLWVIDGDDETDKAAQHHMYAWDLHAAIPGYVRGTSADTVLFMLMNGIHVEVRNAVGDKNTFKSQADLDEYMGEMENLALLIQNQTK